MMSESGLFPPQHFLLNLTKMIRKAHQQLLNANVNENISVLLLFDISIAFFASSLKLFNTDNLKHM